MSGQLDGLYSAVKKPKKLKNDINESFPFEPQEYETPVSSYSALSDLAVEPHSQLDASAGSANRNPHLTVPRIVGAGQDHSASIQLFDDYEPTSSSTYSRLNRRRSSKHQTDISEAQGEDLNNIQVSKSQKNESGLPFCIILWFAIVGVALLVVLIALIAGFVLMINLRSTVADVERSRSTSMLQNASCSEQPNLVDLQKQLNNLQMVIENISNIDNSLNALSLELQNLVKPHNLLITSLVRLRGTVFDTEQQVTRSSEILDNLSQSISGVNKMSRNEINNFTATLVTILHNEHIFDSCTAIMSLPLPFQSGLYRIRSPGGSFGLMFCSMEMSCSRATTEGGWRRLTFFDASSLAADCPDGFRRRSSTPHSCISSSSDPGCTSIRFENGANLYDQVCGRVAVSVTGRPEGFFSASQDIKENYLDGVSLTYGTPRQHIWSHAVLPFDRNCTSCVTDGEDFVGTNFTCFGVSCIGPQCNGDRCGGNPSFYTTS